MTKALYRKYRSTSLDEVVGQKHITDVLARSLKKGLIAHAYLLTGPRGVGKTSIARILAHEINNLPYDGENAHLDIIEIDAASNNGVDNIRDLRDKAHIAPTSASKKIYIIDEVHMLSKSAFNALLKTLEEPPEHVVFILATTDADKLPETIISRTQRFSFRSITREDLAKHLATIAKAEGIAISSDALTLIAQLGDGSFRDSISLLDQLSSLGEIEGGITTDLIESTLGLAPKVVVETILNAVDKHDIATVVKALDGAWRSGVQPSILSAQLIESVKDKIVSKPHYVRLLENLIDIAKSSNPELKLLTVLVVFTDEKVPGKSAALSIPSPSISAPIIELQKQAEKAKPQEPKAKPQPEPPAQPVKSPSIPSPKVSETNVESKTAKKIAIAPVDFNWEALVDYCRTHCVAVYSVLSKSSYEIDGTTLRIYTGNAFYKKKIDNGKHHIDLVDSLASIGAGDLIIDTVPTKSPPKDSKAAAVAAIMGGGEEVSVDL